MTLSIKCTHIVNTNDWCPVSPALCLCAVTACNIALVYCDIRSEDSICISNFSVIHLRRKPIQFTGIFDLVCAVLVLRCRLVMAVRVGLAETVFVPVVIDKAFVLVVGVAVESAAAVFHLFIDLPTGAVENRVIVLTDGLVECDFCLVAVQQVADFTAGEFGCGFALDIFNRSNRRFITNTISGIYIAVEITVSNYFKIQGAHSANVSDSIFNLTDTMAVFDRFVVVTTNTANAV